jgi:hypothetical protein
MAMLLRGPSADGSRANHAMELLDLGTCSRDERGAEGQDAGRMQRTSVPLETSPTSTDEEARSCRTVPDAAHGFPANTRRSS